MRRSQRLISAAVLIALSGALAGCGSTTGWDPTDLLDFLDTKKKLPGDRKPVFPEGVPGMQQGVPREMYKGAQQQQQDVPPPAAVVEAPPPEQPKAARGAKGKKARPVTATAPAPEAAPADADAPAEEGAIAVVPPAPKAKISRRRTTAPPPDQAAEPAPQAAQQAQPAAASPFPAPVPSGTFQR